MTPPPTLIDENGQSVPLERELASGGEGTVFTLRNDATQVAKLYHRPPTDQTIEKLAAMVRMVNPQLLTLAAWPTRLLYRTPTRQPAGFLMPRLVDCRPIQQLYNPVQRLKSFPRAGWNFQVRAAANLAAAFDEVHKAGGLVGDVNQSNAQVSTQALVRLIDCDSFQIRANGKAYLCEVGVAHYIPPELQGKPLRGVIRTENHDRFGLAVLIYQLLFVGRHPYAGVYSGKGDPSFEQLIAEYRFAQGPAASSWNMAPPPHTPTFADIPPELGTLFRRAFERGGETGTRPPPVEWLDALRNLEPSIVECDADPGHTYWRGAKSCVWCRLADRGGPEYYFGVAGSGGTFAADEARLQSVLRRLEACRPIDFPYDRKQYLPKRPATPTPLPDDLNEYRDLTGILAVATFLCVLAMPLALIHPAIGIVGLLGTITFGGWLGYHLHVSPLFREFRQRRVARHREWNGLRRVEESWAQTVEEFRRAQGESRRVIERGVSECRALESGRGVELQRLAANAETLARVRHLRLNLLADADIPKIGAGRKQVLSTNGIQSAYDIDEDRIGNIKGFGPALTGNLMAWREEVIRQFRFDPASAISPAEQRSITVKFRNEQKRIFDELDRELQKLESLAPTCQAELQKLEPDLRRAVKQLEQAEADLRLMTERR